MPTLITHAAPALALGLALGPKIVSPRLLVAAAACSLLPDIDSIGYFMGVPYGDQWGHRGLSHSLLAALAVGFLGFLAAPALKAKREVAAFILFFCYLAHIALDAMTSGGLGVAFWWPFYDDRYFLPWRPIRVSPMNVKALISQRGFSVFISELKWVWLPLVLMALSCLGGRRLGARGK